MKIGPSRQIRPISILGEAVAPARVAWPIKDASQQVGLITSATWSPDFETNVAIGMVDKSHWQAGTELTVDTPQGSRIARIEERFWN